MPTKKKDLYPQLAYLNVTQSGANVLTYAGLSVFSNILSGQGVVIHRIQYLIATATIALMTADTDRITVAVTGDDNMDSLDLDDARVYDFSAFYRQDFGTPANAKIFFTPYIHDFASLPGGGLLVPADKLYVGMDSVGLASAGSLQVRIYFTMQSLSAQEYLELAQSFRVLR